MFGSQYSRAVDPKPDERFKLLISWKKKNPCFFGPDTYSESSWPSVGSNNVLLNKDQGWNHCSRLWFLKTILLLIVAGKKILVPMVSNRQLETCSALKSIYG